MFTEASSLIDMHYHTNAGASMSIAKLSTALGFVRRNNKSKSWKLFGPILQREG